MSIYIRDILDIVDTYGVSAAQSWSAFLCEVNIEYTFSLMFNVSMWCCVDTRDIYMICMLYSASIQPAIQPPIFYLNNNNTNIQVNCKNYVPSQSYSSSSSNSLSSSLSAISPTLRFRTDTGSDIVCGVDSGCRLSSRRPFFQKST
jgi:hypothetical protein